MKRFRWTRRTYQHARHLARLLPNLPNGPSSPPAIVELYWELWEQYPARGDPLLTPLRWRRDYLRDDIPF